MLIRQPVKLSLAPSAITRQRIKNSHEISTTSKTASITLKIAAVYHLNTDHTALIPP